MRMDNKLSYIAQPKDACASHAATVLRAHNVSVQVTYVDTRMGDYIHTFTHGTPTYTYTYTYTRHKRCEWSL